MKYLIIHLEVQDGEHKHDHHVTHTTNARNIYFAAERYAATYWGEGTRDMKDEWWWFNGEFALRVYTVTELNEFEFKFFESILRGNKPQPDYNYFNIVHAGYREEAQREEIQIHAGENGNVFLYPTKEGFVVDVYGQNNETNTMTVWEDDLSGETEDDTTILYPIKEQPENFSDIEIDEFKENWGQSHDEICTALDLDQEGAEGFLVGDYFWVYEDQKWYPTFSSLYSEREQEIADYLQSF